MVALGKAAAMQRLMETASLNLNLLLASIYIVYTE